MKGIYDKINLYLGKKTDPNVQVLSYIAILQNVSLTKWIKTQMELGWEDLGLYQSDTCTWNYSQLEDMKREAIQKLTKEMQDTPLDHLTRKYGLRYEVLESLKQECLTGLKKVL